MCKNQLEVGESAKLEMIKEVGVNPSLFGLWRVVALAVAQYGQAQFISSADLRSSSSLLGSLFVRGWVWLVRERGRRDLNWEWVVRAEAPFAEPPLRWSTVLAYCTFRFRGDNGEDVSFPTLSKHWAQSKVVLYSRPDPCTLCLAEDRTQEPDHPRVARGTCA